MKITINGEIISAEAFERELENQRRQNPREKPERLHQLAKGNIIDWTIIRQEANKSALLVPPVLIENEYARLLQQHGGEKNFARQLGLKKHDLPKVKKDLEQNIKINQFLRNLTRGLPEPTEEEIVQVFEKNPERFTKPEQVHAAQILMRQNPAKPFVAYREMVSIRSLLLEGKDFAEIADEHSSCEDQGGDLGWFAPGKMVPGFDAVVFSMNVGEISPVFLSEYGFHIVTVYEKKPAQLKPLETVLNEISEQIKTDRGDDYIAAWVDERKAAAEIRVEE
jgi:parvulin-like peptidyl-prolyl isomerase